MNIWKVMEVVMTVVFIGMFFGIILFATQFGYELIMVDNFSGAIDSVIGMVICCANGTASEYLSNRCYKYSLE